jgi:membrane glycosyltransferase
VLLRRLVFFAVLLATSAGILALVVLCLAPGGWNLAKVLILMCFLVIAPWLGVCVGNALPGFLILMLARDPARFVLPVAAEIDERELHEGTIVARTALLVTIRNEDIAALLPPMQHLLDGLAPFGDRFTLCLLSDTQDAGLAAVEAAAVARDPRIFYRRRAENIGFKAGNVMEFLDSHGDGFELALMLDADSEMTAAAVLTLVRIMQADPAMGIVQHLTVGRPANAAFARLFQFGMRSGMRVWAVGQAWWQGADGPYWGHNAILRVAPFRAHARLKPLPNGAAILSHDQVEAARLRHYGWKVCVWAAEEGSMEGNPPAMPEFLARDARWLAGNLQYWHLLRLPGFRAMGRWQLVQAMLMFAGAPCYTALLPLAVLAQITAPPLLLTGLLVAWVLTLYAPKLSGYAQVLLTPGLARRYGGRLRFALGALMEFGFSLLLDAVSQASTSWGMIRLAFGRKAGWLPQNRADRGVAAREAIGLFWPHSVFGLFVSVALGPASLPWTAGLVLAVPFCVLTADPVVSAWLRRLGIAATPEELFPSGR